MHGYIEAFYRAAVFLITMRTVPDKVAFAATMVLGGVSIILYSIIFSVMANLSSLGPSNPGGTQIPFNGPYPAYFKNLQAFNQFPHLGFFENYVFYPLGLVLIISGIIYACYRLMKNGGLRRASYQ